MRGKRKYETDQARLKSSNRQMFDHDKNFQTCVTSQKQNKKRTMLYNGSKPFDVNATISESTVAEGEIYIESPSQSESTECILSPHVHLHSTTSSNENVRLHKVRKHNKAHEKTENRGVVFQSMKKVLNERTAIEMLQRDVPTCSYMQDTSAEIQVFNVPTNNEYMDCFSRLPYNKETTAVTESEPTAHSYQKTDSNIKTYNVSKHVSSCQPEHQTELHFSGVSSSYVDLGDCDKVCEHCKATFWYEERLKAYFKDKKPRYHRCCGGGKVVLPIERNPPDYIKDLFRNRHFLDNIRAYNQMFSMTSFGAHVDDSVNNGSGPYVFKITGQVYHWIGALCPLEGDPPRFLQLYIYDTQNELHNRMHHFGEKNSHNLTPQIVQGLIDFLNEHNELVRLFRTAAEKCKGKDVPDFQIRLYSVAKVHQYELPTSETLGAIVFESGPKSKTDYDVIIESKNGTPQRVNKLHPSYMSLQFPLLFIYGQTGFHTEMKLISPGRNEPGRTRRLTMNMYYSYQLHDRFNFYGLLPRGGRLFQQYVVTAYCSIELNRIDYIREKQNDIRNEYLSGLYDGITRGDNDGSDLGTRTILPASFTSSPRYMYSHYLDALAICRVHGNPQFFITFTCNVKWPEVKRFMDKYPQLTPVDRADIVDRIFEMKVKQLINFLKDEKPFGHVIAVLYTIEFQKRGLPHCHTLLWVKQETKILMAEDIDQYIVAELPDPTIDPQGDKVVSEMMMHGPCGLANSGAVCMQQGVCSKNFPKNYNDKTFFDKDGYVHYRRRNTGIYTTKREIKLDNSYVVPYNRLLCLIFHAHINVEYCGWSMLIKYLFKYISKGTDRVVARISRPIAEPSPSTSQQTIQIDEIQNFVDARYICPHEACWRIFNFDIHHREPAVQILAIHLENMQQISFRANQPLQAIVNNSERKRTTLTEWLRFNSNSGEGLHLSYLNFPSEFVWYPTDKRWVPRANKHKPSVGRLTYIHPSSGELFYLRMLLCHQKGCKSFRDIKRVGNNTYQTYRAACDALGLLGDDKEWAVALEEATLSGTSAELRSLVAHI